MIVALQKLWRCSKNHWNVGMHDTGWLLLLNFSFYTLEFLFVFKMHKVGLFKYRIYILGAKGPKAWVSEVYIDLKYDWS